VEILTTNRLDALGEVLTEDIVQEIPQSGERVRGLENIRAVFANYPGQGERGLRTEQLQVLGEEPRYLMSPTFNLVRLEGSGDHPIAVLRSQYPDGSRWWVIVLITMRGDRMAKQITYFAPAFTPPEWRAAWVETMTDGESH
jgi:hypothetical protein